ncbi:MAG: class I SAM-dependent methyltransferase, partial [Lentisphaeria bacterium]|nr:class I SAM-dependent methyltransferase [Lentisphaeria bacterium]
MTSFRSACYSHYVSSGQAPEQAGLDETKRRWYDRQYGPFLRDWRAGERILELGCGSGDFLAYLAERGLGPAEGVDLSPEQTGRASGRGLAVACEDARERLARSAGCYDAIVAFDFLEHFTRDELFELLPLIQAALRPGGRLLVQTPNGAGI